ncbi:MAG: sigma-70 family RNA polymerase sigma factor [Lachnospiraceae bacterium]|nr:sigma-70 family RNA polymerase sigma factor [Lachnospiraceae bacterium]
MAEFKEVYEQYAKKVYYYLLSLTRNAQEAEELLSETFYQAFLHIDKFEGRSSIFTWLCQIGKNAWLKECKRKKHFEEMGPELPDIQDKGESPEVLVIRKEGELLLKNAIFKLEEPYREVFMLRVFAEMKLKDIAAEYSKSEEWARVTYYRAKSKVQKYIESMEKNQGGQS